MIIPKRPEDDEFKPKNYDLLPDQRYFFMYIMSKKGSGKSVFLHNLVRKFTDIYTATFFISATLDKDYTTQATVQYLEKLYERAPENLTLEYGLDTLDWDNLTKELTISDSGDKSPRGTGPNISDKVGNGTRKLIYRGISGYGKEEKPKKTYPPKSRLLVIDDLSEQLNDKKLISFVKRSRHHKTRVIIASQYFHDLAKGLRAQIDYFVIFPAIEPEKVKEITKLMGMDYEPFMYEYRKLKKYEYKMISALQSKIIPFRL